MKLEEAIQTTIFSSEKQKAAVNLLYTAWWLKTVISQELKSAGLTHEQFNVLRILKGKHPETMCVKDVGSRMIERNSNVPRIIDRLVSKELANRSTSDIDKRETAISLTSTGLEILKAANTKVGLLFENLVPLNDELALQLNEILEKMRETE